MSTPSLSLPAYNYISSAWTTVGLAVNPYFKVELHVVAASGTLDQSAQALVAHLTTTGHGSKTWGTGFYRMWSKWNTTIHAQRIQNIVWTPPPKGYSHSNGLTSVQV